MHLHHLFSIDKDSINQNNGVINLAADNVRLSVYLYPTIYRYWYTSLDAGNSSIASQFSFIDTSSIWSTFVNKDWDNADNLYINIRWILISI